VVKLARSNAGWGYDRIVGALANLGHRLSDQTVGNILRRHGLAPAPKRSQNTSWREFIRSHMAVLAGIDFFTVEVLTWRGLVTYYVLFFIHLESRRLSLAGITRHPDEVRYGVPSFSHGAESSRKEQRPLVSFRPCNTPTTQSAGFVSRTARRFGQILLQCRLNSLIRRAHAGD